jgi:tRNA G46 methylase TrmB
MMRDPFLSAVVELLKPGGFIAYKTDHLGCFDELEGILEERKDGKITEITRDLYSCPEYLANNVETEFEQLFRRQKLPINYLRWVKQAECQEKIS